MIRLRNNPIEGSSVRLSLSFRDSFGNYYVPTFISYTILALNKDEESWSVVDEIYKKSLDPASMITVTTPISKIIEGTTLQRKIVFEWTALVDGTYTDFVDEATYEVQPMPYVPDHPIGPTPPEMYVEITGCSLQTGSVIEAPLLPVIITKINLPVTLNDASITLKDDEDNTVTINSNLDTTKTVLTIVTDEKLAISTHYTLTISDLKSGDFVMKEPFVFAFTTTAEGRVQEEKTISITENGTSEVLPSEGFSSMAKVIVNTSVTPNLQNKTVTENGVVECDSEYDGLNRVTVEVPIPVIQEEREVSFNDNGTYNITPEYGYSAMEKTKVNINVPALTLQDEKAVEYNVNGDYIVEPDSDYDGMAKTSVKVAVPVPVIQATKEVEYNTNGTFTVTPDAGNDGIASVTVTVTVPSDTVALYGYLGTSGTVFYVSKEITASGNYNIMPKLTDGDPYVGFASYDVTVGNDEIKFTYSGVEETLTRQSSDDVAR